MSSLRPRRNGNPGQNHGTTPTQPPPTPLHGTRFQVLKSTEPPSANYGHFPSAPETYPIDVPEAVLLLERTPVPEHPVYSNSNLVFSLNSPPSGPSSKRPANSVQLEQPPAPKKRQKKATKPTSDIDSLQGITPPLLMEHPTNEPSESVPAYYGSVLRADPEASKNTPPTLWQHMYKLADNEPMQSVLDSVSSDPILKAKPTHAAYVGCRPCLAVTG